MTGRTGAPPTCATNNWFNATAQKCNKATQAFAASGQFWDNHMGQYDPSGSGTWRDLAASQKSRVVECQDDRNIHGDGGSAKLATNGRTPNGWHTSNEINWVENAALEGSISTKGKGFPAPSTELRALAFAWAAATCVCVPESRKSSGRFGLGAPIRARFSAMP